mmetsp:Transcript_9791/g.27440  ORF Transcript_9791/g.27440 Transcript_9791/m.27440 type:complete len:404 (-) Transcript_9791:1462-2673(-)
MRSSAGPCVAGSGSNHPLRFAQSILLLFFLLLLLCSTSPSKAVAAASAASLDPYKALHLPRGCSQKDIKKAYRRAALKHHPDKVKECDREASEQKFKGVNQAYEILSDESKKSLYDKYGAAALDPNFNPAFAGFGGGGGGGNGSDNGSSRRRSSPGPQPFPFEFHPGGMGSGGATTGGSTIDISSIMEDLRKQMGGAQSGGDSGAAFSQMFGSAGFTGMNDINDMGSSTSTAAPSSNKEYTIPFNCSLEELCNTKTKKLKVKHPAGVVKERIYEIHLEGHWKPGTRVKFRAQHGFPPISFVLKEKGHSFLKRQNDDLVFDCTISPRQAARGAKLSIPLPTGETYKVSTEHRAPMSSDETMRIPGKGMPIRRKKEGGPSRGDLIIRFRIQDDNNEGRDSDKKKR